MASGKNSRLYRNDGTRATPVLVPVPEARNIDSPFTPEKVDDADRSSNFKLYCEGLIETGITTTLSLRNQNANNQHFRAAARNGQVNEYFVLDGPADVPGSEGIRFFGKVFDASKNHPLTDSRTMAVEIMPAHHLEEGVFPEPLEYIAP